MACFQSSPESLNPFVSADQITADILPLIYTPLVLYGERGAYRPHLATEWQWQDDGHRLRFRIRNDLVWHDGKPVTAEDVVWTIRIAAGPAFSYWNLSDFAGLESVRAGDSLSVELIYTNPPPGGLEPFVFLPILPHHLLGQVAPEEFARHPYHRSPVGSGPFRFASRSPDGSVALVRNDAFPQELGRAYLDRIALRAVPEPSALATELRTGGVDLCVASGAVADQVGGSQAVTVEPIEPVGIQAVVLNTAHPPLDNPAVRRALSAALDRQEIATVWSPLARPAGNLLPPGSPWLDPELSQPDGDSAMAAALLEEAGWVQRAGDDVRRNAAGEALQLQFVGPPQYEVPLTVVQAQLRRVGVEADVRFMEFSAYVSTILNPETRPDVMGLGFSPAKLFHPDFYEDLHTEGSRNVSSYSDARTDSVLERLRTVQDQTTREALYRELQRSVARDVPILYTLYVPRLLAVGPRVREVRPDRNGPFATATDWWIPASRRRRAQ